MSALDRIGRVLVLVLSTLATLSIVASLVSVSTPAAPDNAERGEVEIAIEPEPPRAVSTPSAERATPAASMDVGGGPARTAEKRGSQETARWLQALTYAVLGLAGFVAALTIVAMRAAAHLGAIADRR